MAIAGYWAYLMVCTPAWTCVAAKTRAHRAMCRARAYGILRIEAGKPDAKLEQMLAALDAGRHRTEVEVRRNSGKERGRAAQARLGAVQLRRTGDPQPDRSRIHHPATIQSPSMIPDHGDQHEVPVSRGIRQEPRPSAFMVFESARRTRRAGC